MLKQQNGVATLTYNNTCMNFALEFPGWYVVDSLITKAQALYLELGGFHRTHRNSKSSSARCAARRPLTIAPWMEPVSR